MRVELTDDRDVQHDGFVLTQLRAYNAEPTLKDFRALRVFARDAGSIICGLLADMLWEYLEVHVLWVETAHRNVGHATRLMNAAEKEARHRDCKHAFLYTFSFRARGFYEKIGYREFGRLIEFGGKHERYYLHK